ncbi:hypothetical protein [cyanobacterium endosymbiont of Rhopalodia gibberula]|uniref:hypothetical protein n=1 Tax=cyanobacterium endosymbiont of Rhopalodia gibberula TaxID=1763363 RepID=UPI0015583881|nr:hypothetical protein [cyanobacterium endosymbiont of Rhopalodia gibberula]
MMEQHYLKSFLVGLITCILSVESCVFPYPAWAVNHLELLLDVIIPVGNLVYFLPWS